MVNVLRQGVKVSRLWDGIQLDRWTQQEILSKFLSQASQLGLSALCRRRKVLVSIPTEIEIEVRDALLDESHMAAEVDMIFIMFMWASDCELARPK